MSDEFKLKFTVELDGKEGVDDFFKSSEGAANHLQSTLNRAFKQSGAVISAFAGKAKSELQDFAGKELGGSIGSNARGILQLRDSITALAIASDKGTDIVAGLKDQIQSTAIATNQLQGDVTDATRAFVDQTGDLDTARKNMETYGRVATATGAAMKEVALIGVEIKDKLKIDDQAKAFAILAELSKGGAIHIRDLAKQGPRLFNVAVSAGVSGEEGLREIGALAETYAKYVGGSGASKAARVSTAVENTFSSIAKKASKLEAAGIQVEGRDRFEVLFDIIRKTGGNETKLRDVFTQQAMRAILGVANEYKRTGKFGDYEDLKNRVVDPHVLDTDYAARTGTGASKMKQQQIVRQAFVDKYLGGIAEFAAAHATEIQAGAFGLGILGKGMGLLGRAGSNIGGKLGGALSNVTAQRVFVVNMPAGGFGGMPDTPSGKLSGIATKIGVAGAVLGAGLYGIDKFKAAGDERLDALENAGVQINQNQLEMKRRNKESKIAMLERHGFEHGKAVYLAEHQVQNHIKIEIHDKKAIITEGDGTRSVVSLSRRKAEGD